MRSRRWVLSWVCAAGCTVGVDSTHDFEAQGAEDEADDGAPQEGEGDDDDDDESGDDDAGTGEADPDDGDGGDTGLEDDADSGDESGDEDTGGVPSCDADLDVDSNHCGSCDHRCLGGLCEAGACQPILLAAGMDWPNFAVAEGDRIVVGADDGIYSVPKTGGGAQLLHIGTVRHIVVDEERIYWVDSVANDIASIAIGGTQATIHVTPIQEPWGLVADEDNLYWVDGGVNRIAKTGGSVHVLVPEAGDGFYPWQLGIGGGRVYYRTEGGDLRSVLTSGGGDVLLDHSPATYYNADFHDGLVYAFRGDVGVDTTTLVRMSPAGDGAPQELISGQAFPQPMAIDDTHVYWRVFADESSQIVRMAHDGGTAEILAAFPGFSLGLTVDDEAVYWCETDHGNVVKLAK